MSSEGICDVLIEDEKSHEPVGGGGGVESNSLGDFDFESDAKEIESIEKDKNVLSNASKGSSNRTPISNVSYIRRSSLAKFPRPNTDPRVIRKKLVFDSGQQHIRSDIVTPDSVRVDNTAGRLFEDIESEEEGVTLVCADIDGNELSTGGGAVCSGQSHNQHVQGNDFLKEEGGILTIKTFGQSSHLQRVAMMAQRNQSYHPTIVARLPSGCEATIGIAKVGDHEEYGIGCLSNPLSDLLSEKCVNLFSDIFQNIGVYRLSDASDFLEIKKNGFGLTNKPMTLLFMAENPRRSM